MTRDHKPEELSEKIRIAASGGRVYKLSNESHADGRTGPFRVFPGRLSVSRTFGDPAAKLVKHGGKPGVVIPVPDIFSFEILPSYDFLVLGCDGIFDQLSSQDVISCVWNSISSESATELHGQCAAAANAIVKTAINHHSLDNVTSILIAFENFKENAKTNNEHMKGAGANRSSKYGVRQVNLPSRNVNALRVETAPPQRFSMSKRLY